ncbi:MAG: orotidine 5'-phosphate decarboxylase [Deltaproteobacteria bacterium RBG_13_53_10]|nr:MAG: orotidine 5'-phosphate decarboxylase [Deltaproteobacteria bacterium RBG_13_53_10]
MAHPPIHHPKDRIIFALDVEHFSEAQSWVNLLKDQIGVFKVGKQLFTHAGPKVIDMIRKRNQNIFLDLKFHDIPTTVAKAGAEATKLNVSIFDLHALGGFEMMRKTVEASRTTAKELGIPKPLILAITILTSMDEDSLKEVGIRGPLLEEVGQLALLAMKAGLDGVVASPQEIGIIRQKCGERFLIVTPGIRLPSDKKDDQKRTLSPKEAISAGADYLVIGRPIKEAKDPLEAVQRIVEDIS